MKPNRIILCLMTSLCVAVQAQEKVVYQGSAQWDAAPSRILAESGIVLGHAKLEKEAGGKTLATWPGTENVKDKTTYWTTQVLRVESKGGLVALMREASPHPSIGCTAWRLCDEEGQTVLHCYLLMPADAVQNLWLGSEETYIVDQDTGIRYRPRVKNTDTWGKYFGYRAPRGTVIDCPIYFPPLPETVRHIAIHGVPAWHLRGQKFIIDRARPIAEYDTIPQFVQPRMVRPEQNYDKNNSGSWAVYTGMHLVKPFKKERTMAMWRTPETTYVAMALEQNWTREYFGFEPGTVLVDQKGRQYKLRRIQGLPTEHIFWNEGVAGDWFAVMMEFDPLPLDVTTITYIAPEGEPFKAWGANWSGESISGLDIETLRKHQALFRYAERVFVE